LKKYGPSSGGEGSKKGEGNPGAKRKGDPAKSKICEKEWTLPA